MPDTYNLSTMFEHKKREKIMQLVQDFTPTSKASLKQFCIMATNGKVEEAEKLYAFYIKDMEELPMFDPVPPTFIDNAKTTMSGLFGFVRENKDGIGQIADMVRGIISKKGAAGAAEALPEIN